MLAVPALDRDFVRSHLWCFHHFCEVRGWLRIALAILTVAACTEAAGRGLRRLAITAGRRIRALRLHRAIVLAGVGISLFALFWLLRDRNFALGDSARLQLLIPAGCRQYGLFLTFDEPLELLTHSWP